MKPETAKRISRELCSCIYDYLHECELDTHRYWIQGQNFIFKQGLGAVVGKLDNQVDLKKLVTEKLLALDLVCSPLREIIKGGQAAIEFFAIFDLIQTDPDLSTDRWAAKICDFICEEGSSALDLSVDQLTERWIKKREEQLRVDHYSSVVRGANPLGDTIFDLFGTYFAGIT